MSENGSVVANLEIMPLVNKILSSSPNFESRIFSDYDSLAQVCGVLKAMEKRIVMTKGVYDLLHVGHLRYIAEAKKRGDILVISVDTDELTRMRKSSKSKNRPIVPLDERIEMLLHSRYVDIITIRDVKHHGKEDDTEAVRPDVLVKSKTTEDDPDGINKYLNEKLGIEIVVLDSQAPTSTTARIRTLMIDGAEELADVIINAVSKFISGLKGE